MVRRRTEKVFSNLPFSFVDLQDQIDQEEEEEEENGSGYVTKDDLTL